MKTNNNLAIEQWNILTKQLWPDDPTNCLMHDTQKMNEIKTIFLRLFEINSTISNDDYSDIIQSSAFKFSNLTTKTIIASFIEYKKIEINKSLNQIATIMKAQSFLAKSRCDLSNQEGCDQNRLADLDRGIDLEIYSLKKDSEDYKNIEKIKNKIFNQKIQLIFFCALDLQCKEQKSDSFFCKAADKYALDIEDAIEGELYAFFCKPSLEETDRALIFLNTDPLTKNVSPDLLIEQQEIWNLKLNDNNSFEILARKFLANMKRRFEFEVQQR